MSTGTTFDSTKRELQILLRDIAAGKTQLPDFQRGWVWDDRHIVSLLASISLSYPIGAIMLMETGGEEVRFKPRPVEGTPAGVAGVKPEHLILDGQQRLTSLFQALMAKGPVATRDARGAAIKRWYYIDIAKALTTDTDREDAIIGVPEERVIRDFRGTALIDVSTPQKEYEKGFFPLALVFDCSEWRRGHGEFWNHDRDKTRQFDQFEKLVVDRFKQYLLPVITLLKQTPKEAVCQVFEKVNTGGVSLTVFELLTATFAADDFNLRDDWSARRHAVRAKKLLHVVREDDFLQAISLLATHERRLRAVAGGTNASEAPGISCKRKDILRLSLNDYRSWSDRVSAGFETAAQSLHQQRIFRGEDLPYRTQLVPLAAIFTALGDVGRTDGARQKVMRWYWCGIFGELYGGAIESRFAKDLAEVVEWVRGGPEPTTVTEASFNAARLHTLRTRNSAAYKGLYAVLIRDGGLDFRSGDAIDNQIYFDESIDIHHIFPRKWCDEHQIPAKRYDSIINKTAISAKTNRIIGGRAPSVYLAALQRQADISPDRMDQILQSHVIDPALLRGDDFEAFFQARAMSLLARIEQAMGKKVSRELPTADEVDLFGDSSESLDDDESPEGSGV